MKKILLLTLVCLIIVVSKAQIPPGYYNNAQGLSGYELKSALNVIITNGHIDQGYGALYSAYVQGDTDPDDGFLWDMYSEIPGGADPYNYTHNENNCGTYSAEGDCYNREHLMPQSVFNEQYPMRSDYFHIIPTDGYVNGRRSNYAFGEVTSPTWTSLNGSKVGPCDASLGYTGTVFEPIDEYKGDIARSLFYFATRYETQIDAWSHPMINGTEDQVFSDWFLAILLKWHEQDPVSTKEITRNTAGYNFQGNANPFISHPEWVESIWGEAPAINLSFTSAPVTEATQDNSYTYNITFQGEAGGTFTITKESTDEWLSLTDITNNSATLTGTPLAANLGTTSVSLKLTDGTDEVFQNFDIEVTGSVIPGNDVVFINEIHYDNDGGDVNEAIEIAGAAGTDLTGWSIVLYNGSNGESYNTINLSGAIPNQQNGFGTVIETLPSNGLQNGAPDGLALIDNNGAVVQFLSYEGTINATNGPANGLTSTDIGVSETSSTPIGHSLQLSGTGTKYTDFTWQSAGASTYDAPNTDQSFGSATIPAVINEFVFNHTGSDTDEFVEILSDPNTDLSEYYVLEIEGDINAAGTIDEIIQLGTTDANGYFATAFAANQFENGTLGLLLVKNFTGAAGTDLDTDDDGVFDATPWEEIIDDIGVNDGGTDDINYASVTLLQGFDGSSFTVGGASRIPNGTDTDVTSDWVRNDFDGAGLPSYPTAEADAGEAINTPGAENEVKVIIIEPTVVINEFVFNHTGSDTDEFVEVLSDPDTDLSEYYILEIEGDINAAGTIDEVIQLGTTDANGYFATAFASNQFENGTLGLLLVKNFTGTAGTDLDTDDDGVFDTTPWDKIIDDIGVNDGGTDDINYASVTLLSDFDGSTFTVGGASRVPNGTDTEAITDWARNDYDGAGLPSFPTVEAEDGEAINTPGTENEVKGVVIVANVFINEIHYDNASTDVGEAIEVAGEAGTDLAGWSIVLYNGNGGASYNTTALSGIIPDQDAGYGTLSFEIAGIQNGAPDGFALVNSTNEVIQFLSYEGSFVAVGGPADGMTSEDIGVMEASSTPVGNSLQLAGEGTTYTDFTWQEAATSTFGSVNTNQFFSTPIPPVFVNEIHYDNSSTDVDEAVEVAGPAGTDLTGWSIVLYNGNGGTSYNTTALSGTIPDQDAGYGTLSFAISGIQNGAPDGLALVEPAGSVIQFLSYEGVFTATDGPAEGIESVDIGVSESSSTEIGYSLQLTGTGTAYEDFTWIAPAISSFGTVNNNQYFGDEPPVNEPITILEARNSSDGTTVTISGVLTVADQFNGSAYIQDATGAIAVFDAQVHGAGLFNIGDSLTITGTRSSYNEQVQISPVTSVVNNGLPTNPIIPVDVTLNELGAHPGELVRVVNTTFPSPGNLLFGNSNFVLTDASGTGEMRIDADAPGLAGLGQPETCAEITGVVGRYYEIYQLLPRMAEDMPCAGPYEPTGNDLSISKDLTLDVATWNIEWFGDESNSPAGSDADQVQKDSVKAVLLGLDADIIGVEEIADDALMAQLVSEMPGYDYVLSDATSYPNGTGVKQKVGFIYKTATVSPVSTKVLLESVHPYYNGGDASYLTDYPDADASRFFASGRLPFMFTADVTINGATERISFIDLHARANNNSDAQARYDMRKYDVEALKDTLDMYYANENIVMVGDYNDDVDETVVDVNTTESSYITYVNDVANYNVVSSSLSDADYRSYVFYPNMIDHIMLSNELSSKYIDGSSRVHYEFYDSDFVYTTSDHMPVSARLMLQTLEVVSVAKTDISCNGNADGTATITVQGGIEPYTFEWSDGQTTPTAINLVAGTYAVYVTDETGTTVSTQVVVGESAPMQLTMVETQTVYYGYPYASTATLSATEISGGTPDYVYEWSTGETTEAIEVAPVETSVYTLTVTDANNCSINGDVLVNVEDITCGYGRFSRVLVCYYGWTFCVPTGLVPWLSTYGVELGSCNTTPRSKLAPITAESFAEMEEALNLESKAFPNPFTDQLILSVESKKATDVELLVYSLAGELVHAESRTIGEGKTLLDVELDDLKPGAYILKTIGLEESAPIRIVKK